MLGLMNDCFEKLVISKFGVEVWEAVKERAGCDVKNDGFLKLESYHDDATSVLVECVNELTGLSLDEVYRLYGAHFPEYISGEGYENLLYCQGRTLKEWMASINSIHNHLQTTFPNRIVSPEFWCEENKNGTLSLFYMSSRGHVWAAFVQGLVTECARRQFDLHITMEIVSYQGEQGARFTSWIVATENPDHLWRLRTAKGLGDPTLSGSGRQSCPFSGMVINTGGERADRDFIDTVTLDTVSVTETSLVDVKPHKKNSPFDGIASRRGSSCSRISGSLQSGVAGSHDEGASLEQGVFETGSLSASTTRKLFPYHVVIDQDFSITQVGMKLASVLGTNEKVLYNYDIDEVFRFTQPNQAKWTRSWMRKLEDQEFSLRCILNLGPENVLFKGTLVATNPGEVMLVLCPEANNLKELREMNLTMTDLPAHGAYRDAVFLREHLSKQLNNALRMEKLSKTLQTEKELLESLLPKHAAEGLRKGEAVKPRIHHNVTMFFSDIVGFTNICKRVDPREVVDMLNRLYMVMDYLAKKFNLFKIETIGDAYVAASGLPDADVNHATNVANFAIAVTHISRRVLSPVDGSPIMLRIGVNSGRCCSGIVGVTNPRYCVFGDTVNTTARHESTGEAGRVHGSMTTMLELLKQAPDDFLNESRGMVEMKGKGWIPTYWLSSTVDNPLTNEDALNALDVEVANKFADMLKQEGCLALRKKKKASLKTTGMDEGCLAQRKKKNARPRTTGMDDKPNTNIASNTGPVAAFLGDSYTDLSTGIEDGDCSSDSDDSGYGTSSASYTSSSYSLSSPIDLGGRPSFVPSKLELMQMLGQFIDGDREVDDLVNSIRETPHEDKMVELNDAVDEALRLLDDEDIFK